MKKTRVLAKRLAVYALSTLLVIGSFSSLGQGQVITTGRISGTVTDPQGAVVSKAQVVVKNNETGAEFRVETSEDGTYAVSSLPVGIYSVTVTAQGFKQTVVTNVKTEVGAPSTVNVTLEVGAASESVTVTSGAEVLNRENTNVGAVVTGRQITELPFTSRDALDVVLTMPGTASPGRPRQSTVNGLPKGALNISLDGINVQDNTLRSTDGYFTIIRPRIDAIEEVQVSTATPGAEASAGGAVHIRFVTKAGTNDYHGGAWWYHRQKGLNSNYYFNNLRGLPRDPHRLQQWGVKVGGPITPWLKDHAFFFFAYDEYRQPSAANRTRTVFNPDIARGIFKYPGGPAGGVNLFDIARTRCPANANCPTTIDPTIGNILSLIQQSTAKGSLQATTDPNYQQFTFTNTGNQVRRFPTLRLDFNITSKHHLEMIGNYQDFAGTADFLNGADPAFPPPVPQIVGSQSSNRVSGAFAVRSQFSSAVVNEARFGKNGSTVVFFPEPSPSSFAPFGSVAPLISSGGATDVFSTNTLFPSRRNAPVTQLYDNLSWTKGRHSLNFGASFNRTTFFSQSTGNGIVPNIGFGLPAQDPAQGAFTGGATGTLPGADPTQVANARAIYATLVGKITSVNFSAGLDEDTKKYSIAPPFAIQRNSVNGFGFYFQDYFKVTPNLNINYGLRWEAGLAPRHNNEVYTTPTFEGLFGLSGPGNLFNPGTTGQGASVLFPVTKDTRPFADDLNNFGPSIGFAWSPQFKNSWLKFLFGEGEKTVIRSAYAVSYVTGGFADFTGIWGGNPGLFRPVSLLAGRDFATGSLLLRSGLPPFTLPTRAFPLATRVGESISEYNPNLRTPYVQSWTFGIQREITQNTAIEFRYVGNHGTKLGRNLNLNEVNIFENGFLQEFIAAQNNLRIFQTANPNCGQAASPGQPAPPPCSFRNAGLAGQVNLPIFTASFGTATANFSNATILEQLRQGRAGATAITLGNSTAATTFQANRIMAGLPANLFIVNPSVMGANSTFQTNGGDSTYNSLQIELRRRLSGGLVLNGSYVFSHAITNNLAFGTNQPVTLRNLSLNKGESPFDLRHAFKLSYVWDLPFGSGRRFDVRGPGGVIGAIIDGWQTDGIIRWQTGRMFLLNSGRQTVNGSDSGVILVGMDAKELQKAVAIRKVPDNATRGTVLWLPDDIIENTLRAFGLRPGAPSGRYIAPPTTPGRFGSRILLRGPNFFRADLSIIRKQRITERANVEFRAEFLNAFNNPNFLIGGSPAVEGATIPVSSLQFGQTGFAYFDQSTTDDPGGRLVQFVFRVNF